MEKENLKKRDSEEVPDRIANDKAFLGHPKAIGMGSIMALFYAFANYGSQSILIYYLYLSAQKGGVGLPKMTAVQLIGFYAALSSIFGIFGSYLVDRFIGLQKAIFIGFGLKAVAYTMLVIPGGGVTLYFVYFVLMLIASACSGQNLNALMGKVYRENDSRRDSGFSLLYIANNIGAAAPAITGAIAAASGYHMGFLVSALLQYASFLSYVLLRKRYVGDIGLEPVDPMPGNQGKRALTKILSVTVVLLGILVALVATGVVSANSFMNMVSTVCIFVPIVYFIIIITSKKVTGEEAGRVKSLIPMFIGSCLTLMVWNQSTGVLAVYAEERVNLNILGFAISPAAFQTVPAVLAIVMGSFFSFLWLKLGKHQPNTPSKFGFGTILWGFGPLFMMIPLSLFGPEIKVNPLWLIFFYVFIIAGEACTSPIGFSAATYIAPAAFTSQMVNVWQLSASTGAGLSTLAANFYVEGNEPMYFLFIGGITVLVGLFMVVRNKKINHGMGYDNAGLPEGEQAG